MASIKVHGAPDGTFFVLKNGSAVCSGLTRPKAERMAALLRWTEPGL